MAGTCFLACYTNDAGVVCTSVQKVPACSVTGVPEYYRLPWEPQGSRFLAKPGNIARYSCIVGTTSVNFMKQPVTNCIELPFVDLLGQSLLSIAKSFQGISIATSCVVAQCLIRGHLKEHNFPCIETHRDLIHFPQIGDHWPRIDKVLAQLSRDPAVKAAILKVKRSRDDDAEELAESPHAKSAKTTDDDDDLLAETMAAGSIRPSSKTDTDPDSDS